MLSWMGNIYRENVKLDRHRAKLIGNERKGDWLVKIPRQRIIEDVVYGNISTTGSVRLNNFDGKLAHSYWAIKNSIVCWI